jgi:hypothetical protein
MLTKAVIVFLLLMALVAMVGKALFRNTSFRKGPPKLGKPPVCLRCGRYLAGPGGCDCGRKG